VKKAITRLKNVVAEYMAGSTEHAGMTIADVADTVVVIVCLIQVLVERAVVTPVLDSVLVAVDGVGQFRDLRTGVAVVSEGVTVGVALKHVLHQLAVVIQVHDAITVGISEVVTGVADAVVVRINLLEVPDAQAVVVRVLGAIMVVVIDPGVFDLVGVVPLVGTRHEGRAQREQSKKPHRSLPKSWFYPAAVCKKSLTHFLFFVNSNTCFFL